jgi:hypothetical protein
MRAAGRPRRTAGRAAPARPAPAAAAAGQVLSWPSAGCACAPAAWPPALLRRRSRARRRPANRRARAEFVGVSRFFRCSSMGLGGLGGFRTGFVSVSCTCAARRARRSRGRAVGVELVGEVGDVELERVAVRHQVYSAMASTVVKPFWPPARCARLRGSARRGSSGPRPRAIAAASGRWSTGWRCAWASGPGGRPAPAAPVPWRHSAPRCSSMRRWESRCGCRTPPRLRVMRPARLNSMPVAWRLPDSRLLGGVSGRCCARCISPSGTAPRPARRGCRTARTCRRSRCCGFLGRGVGMSALLLPGAKLPSANW